MLCGVSGLAFAIGVYLPLATMSPLYVGGCVRALAERGRPPAAAGGVDPGVLAASGLVAGEGLAGVLVAALVATGVVGEAGRDACFPWRPASSPRSRSRLLVLLFLYRGGPRCGPLGLHELRRAAAMKGVLRSLGDGAARVEGDQPGAGPDLVEHAARRRARAARRPPAGRRGAWPRASPGSARRRRSSRRPPARCSRCRRRSPACRRRGRGSTGRSRRSRWPRPGGPARRAPRSRRCRAAGSRSSRPRPSPRSRAGGRRRRGAAASRRSWRASPRRPPRGRGARRAPTRRGPRASRARPARAGSARGSPGGAAAAPGRPRRRGRRPP